MDRALRRRMALLAVAAAIAAALFASAADAICANGCSGHGACLPGDICSCNSGWAGDDCSVYDRELQSGVSVANQEVAVREWKFYHIYVSNSATLEVNVVQTSVGGDSDVYIQKGTFPAKDSFLVRDTSGNKNVTLSVPRATGTYYIGLYGWVTAISTIKATIKSVCPNGCSGNGECQADSTCLCETNFVGGDCSIEVVPLEEEIAFVSHSDAGEWEFYRIDYDIDNDHSHEHDNLAIVINAVTDGAPITQDLYVKYGALPSATFYDHRQVGQTTGFKLSIGYPQEGSYYIGVYGRARSDYTITLFYHSQSCPNLCSGPSHGTCDPLTHECECATDYGGFFCNERITPLRYGVPVIGYVSDNSWNYYTLNTYTTANANVTLSQEDYLEEDCDLYIARDRTPTLLDFDYRDYSFRQHFSILVKSPGYATSWKIGVLGYVACNYTLNVTLSRVCLNDCSGALKGTCYDGTCACNSGWTGTDCSVAVTSLANGGLSEKSVAFEGWMYYSFTAKVGSKVMVVMKETATTGYLWLFANPEHAGSPTLSSHVYSDTTRGNVHVIEATPSSNGKIIVGVHGNSFGVRGSTYPFKISIFQPQL